MMPTMPPTAPSSARPPRTTPDPGSPRSRLVALVLAILLAGVAFSIQNIPPVLDLVDRADAPATPEQPATETGPAVRPPDFSTPFGIMAKLYIKLADAVASDPSAMPTLDGFATDPADQVRAAIVAAEVQGPEEALDRLSTLAEDLPEGTALRADTTDLAILYTDGPDALPQDARDRLLDHHGFFAEVALTHGLPDTDPARAPLVEGGTVLLAVFGTLGLVFGGAILAGCVLFVVGIALIATRVLRPRFRVPEPGGSVMLEVFCWFVGGFLVVSLGADFVRGLVQNANPDATWPNYIPLLAQWLLLLAPLWPLLRGMSKAELAERIGWNTGSGLFKEMGFGVLAYLAGLPLFLGGVALTLGLMTLVEILLGSDNAAPPTSPVVEMVAGGSPLALVLLFLLATVWAPLCEELVFRGALQRHFRGRLGPIAAALAAAACFGFMHGYGPLFVFPLIALGTVFSLMRELRGSLIPSITAHALHNGTVLIAVLVLLQLVG
jgi:membrane protease YdiL (CAAX protease family)